jgi:hypothetical protein
MFLGCYTVWVFRCFGAACSIFRIKVCRLVSFCVSVCVAVCSKIAGKGTEEKELLSCLWKLRQWTRIIVKKVLIRARNATVPRLGAITHSVSLFLVLFKHTETHQHTYFYPEDRGRIYHRNVRNIATIVGCKNPRAESPSIG